MPVAAGKTVNVLGDVTVNWALDNWQKHNKLPAPAPVELRNTANLMLVNEAPEAVNAKPTVDIVNFICFAEVPDVQYAVAGTKFLPPVEFNAQVTIATPENKMVGTTKMDQVEPGNITMSVYLKTLRDLDIDIDFGDYVGYYDSENFVRYYTVVNDGRVVSDTKHTYKGYKPFYRTIIAAPVGPNEFRGLWN